MNDALRLRFPDGELETWAALGHLTDRSVRVWLRRSEPGATTARLRIGGAVVAEGTLEADADADLVAAATLESPEPHPDADFVVEVGGMERRGRLAPRQGASVPFTFTFASCHQPFEGPDERGAIRPHAGAGIYPLMREQVLAGGSRFLLLIGDQVYSDGLDEVSVRKRLKSDGSITDAELVATYRHLHRGYFNEPGFRSVTETVPAYFTWDDHDIFEGWGSQLAPGDHDHRLYRAAETAYVEYQHLRNPGASLGDRPPFHYRFWFGDVGFFVLDLRGCRSYQEKRVLGERQWHDLEAFLAEADGGGTTTLFVTASVPVVHFSPFIANSLDWVPGSQGTDVRDRWSVAAFAHERERLLARLFDWQSGMPRRQVAILSGDVHVATAFRVRRKRGPAELIQWVSSALSTPGGLKHSVVNRLGTKLVNLGEGTTHATRRGFASGNNFGSIAVEPHRDGGHTLTFTVHEHDREAGALRRAFTDTATPG